MRATEQMPLGFCWTFAEDVAPEDGLPRLRAAGFEGVELWPRTLAAFGAARWARALAACEMRCWQVCPYLTVVAGAAEIARSRLTVQQTLDTAAALSCARVRVFTGPPAGPDVVGARDATPQQWDDAIGALREWCDLATTFGTELCLECHEGMLMEDSPSALRLLRGVNRPNLTTNLQLPLRDEPWEASVMALGATTTHMHIHNWTVGFGQGEWTSLAQGAFDWQPCLRALLARSGRPLCVSLEHADHLGRDDPWQTAQRDGPFLRALRDQILADLSVTADTASHE